MKGGPDSEPARRLLRVLFPAKNAVAGARQATGQDGEGGRLRNIFPHADVVDLRVGLGDVRRVEGDEDGIHLGEIDAGKGTKGNRNRAETSRGQVRNQEADRIVTVVVEDLQTPGKREVRVGAAFKDESVTLREVAGGTQASRTRAVIQELVDPEDACVRGSATN